MGKGLQAFKSIRGRNLERQEAVLEVDHKWTSNKVTAKEVMGEINKVVWRTKGRRG